MEYLKSKNVEINSTINFKILSEKYSFLDNIIDMIVTDIDIQDQILSLSDERLALFKQMYFRLTEITDYYNPYITLILQKIGYISFDTAWQNKRHFYDNMLQELDTFIKSGGVLTNKEIDTILYLCTSSVKHTVPSLNEMKRFGEPDTIDQIEYRQMIDNIRKTKNIKEIKFLLLSKIYGINYYDAIELCKRYDISGLEVTNENKDIFEMYVAICQIVNEDDADVLIQLYDEFMKQIHPKRDFRRIVVFENEMRKSFAHDLGNKIYKPEDKPYSLYDDIKVYDAGVDFKLIITAIGAYQSNFKDKDNYSEYWNSPYIRSHGNCCSLISNTNLSMATVKNVIFGFSTMSDNMLLLSGSSDINSTPASRSFNTTDNLSQRFMNADKMIDNTRGDYNELVYERRDLSSNPTLYKKNPDYIVFIEEYENFDSMLKHYKDNPKNIEYLMKQKKEQERKWKESLKAAKDFDIPVVKINREKVAKSEISIIKKLIDEFCKTNNPSLISQIITRFENNRVGNCGMHAPIREKYFSQKNMNYIIEKIKERIDQIDDVSTKNMLFLSLYNAIIEEEQKVNNCKLKRNNHQIPGIDFKKELADIEEILSNLNIDYQEEVRKK